LEYILDLLAVRLVPDRALKDPMQFNLVLADGNESQSIDIRNGVLVHEKLVGGGHGFFRTLKMNRADFVNAVLTRGTATALSSDDAVLLGRFSSLFDAPRTGFGLVTSRPRG
jgi:alkyl sulfatase BDS1-like metallo-beta-lactamase superfamily hydrolase